MLYINQDIISLITTHARHGLPYEVCGYLAERDGIITSHYELTNMDESADHFSMDPGEQFAAIKDMRKKGLTLKGAYHSHPETPSRPSEEDIRLAYDPQISTIIISLAESEPVIKSFRIIKGEVQEEQIEIVPNISPNIIEDTMTSDIKADRKRDCRGVGCPMNMVYTKVELSKLQSGQILGVIIDDGAPINNVPGSIKKEGHEIVKKSQLEDGAWHLLIKKS